MDRGTQAGAGFGRRFKRLTHANWCAAGCGNLAAGDCLYCEAHRQHVDPDDAGPAPDCELDVNTHGLYERLADKPVERGVSVCAHADCGQPCVAGRLYCSDRCRRRGRREPALFTIDGLTASVREHAQARGIDLGTVYARMRDGLTAVEALTRPIDGLQHFRRTKRAA